MASDTNPVLSILIPVYNGATTVGPLVDALSKLDITDPIEVVLVNDGSRDNSAEVCRELTRTATVPVVFLDLSRNFGEHNAVMTGLRHCRGDYIITMDDDLQNPPSEVVKLYEQTKSQDFDVVYTFYADKRDSAYRNLGSLFANWTANLVIDKPRDLYLSSFRCMRRFVATEICRYEGPQPYVDGLIFQVTQRVGRIQVEHLPRTHQASNYTLRKLIRLWLSLLLNFSVLPLRIATGLGIFFALASLAGGIYVLSDFVLYGVPVQGWVSLILSVLMFSGVQLLMLGIVGEYVGRQYLATNRKPQGIVRTIHRGDGRTGTSTDDA